MSKRRSLAGLRRKKKLDFFTAYDEKPTKNDFKLVKERILENSLADEWDEARREWELTKLIDRDDMELFDRFTEQCQLCNQVGLKKNYQIFNPGTGKIFLVGSTCIKKFLLLKGAETQQQSADIFDFQVKQMLAVKKLQQLLPDILSEPTAYDANRFRNASREILETLDNLQIKKTTWNKYIKLLFGTESPHEKSIERVRNVIFQPSKLRFKKVKDLSTGEEEGRWADKIKTKTKVETTLSRSKEYRPDRNTRKE
ncbi:MAG: hypothetical protein FH756_01750 [Firmicutes bacterium]|nr:hypothetical protein [Bacillota bacterium]